MEIKDNFKSMSLGSILNLILTRYSQERKGEFTNNKLAKQIRNEFPTAIDKILNSKYKVSGSAGLSKWAMVPWIGIFDKEISNSAQGGYYVVYLFTEDMQGVYLSVNQGYTHYQESYKNPNTKIKYVSNYWKTYLKNIPDRFILDDIYLYSHINKKTSPGRPNGYVYGNICSIYYSIDNLPKEKVLVDDLYNALSILSEIKRKLIGLDYKYTNKFILSQTNEERVIETTINEKQFEKQFDSKLSFQTYQFQCTTQSQSSILEKHTRRKIRKTDYIQLNEKNKKLGYAGECAVIEYERNKLLNSSNVSVRELANKIRHCSVEDGDGLGYDIQSFDVDGNEIYIEVKTTLKGIDTPFYITNNELNASCELKKRYYLYRLYDVNIQKESIKFYTLNGPLNECLELKNVNFIALPK